MFNFFKKSFKKEESAVEKHNKKMEEYANQFSGFSLNLNLNNEVKSSSACSNAWNDTNFSNNVATSTILDESLDNLCDYGFEDSVLSFESDTDFELEDYSIYEDMF